MFNIYSNYRNIAYQDNLPKHFYNYATRALDRAGYLDISRPALDYEVQCFVPLGNLAPAPSIALGSRRISLGLRAMPDHAPMNWVPLRGRGYLGAPGARSLLLTLSAVRKVLCPMLASTGNGTMLPRYSTRPVLLFA